MDVSLGMRVEENELALINLQPDTLIVLKPGLWTRHDIEDHRAYFHGQKTYRAKRHKDLDQSRNYVDIPSIIRYGVCKLATYAYQNSIKAA